MSQQKKGGVDRYILVIIILLLFLGSFSTIFQDPLTGMQTRNISIDEVKGDVEQLTRTLPFMPSSGAEACVLVDMGNDTVYSYDLQQTSEGPEVQERPQSRYCDNDGNLQGPEDFVIKFTSYEGLQRTVEDPSCSRFLQGGRGDEFYYLPSEFIEQGGEPVCNEQFKQTYCPAISACVSDSSLMKQFFPCCRQPSIFERAASSAGSWWVWVALAAGILGIGLGAFFFFEKRSFSLPEETKEEMHSYIQRMKQRGYIDEQIKEQLRSQGWSDDVLKRFFPKR